MGTGCRDILNHGQQSRYPSPVDRAEVPIFIDRTQAKAEISATESRFPPADASSPSGTDAPKSKFLSVSAAISNMKDTGKHYDLIVIGAGILGTFHAYHAAERGLKVALVEKNSSPRDATVRNFGQAVPSGFDQDWQRIGRRSLEIYQSIQSRFDITARNNGSLYVASNDEEQTLLDELAVINKSNGYSSERWSVEQCRARYPRLCADYCRGGLFFPEEFSINPLRMIHRLHQFMAERGKVDLYYRTLVQELDANADGTVTARISGKRTLSADKVIVCCGHEFQSLFPEIFAQSAMEIVKLQMLRLKPQLPGEILGNLLTGLTIRRYESFKECPSYEQIIAAQPADSFSQKWGVHILFKQEADGGIILGDSHEYMPAARADEIGYDLREDVNRYFIDEGRKIMDLPSWEIESSWNGFYCQTKESGGVFRHKPGKNIHVITGIGGKGVTGSPGFAEKNINAIFS